MSCVIKSIKKGSPLDKQGINPGDTLVSINDINAGDVLVSINGYEIIDVLDYQFYCAQEFLCVKIQKQNGDIIEIDIEKDEYEELGAEFETYLMDKHRGCKNNCIFCFVDQLPENLRDSLYFKDDDHRLSFLLGNYITLTNVTQKEIDRIIKMNISPINISVHTMNPKLRTKMMRNKNAGEVLKHLYKLAKADIKTNCQLVLCSGINDGKELEYSLNELHKLGNCVQSIACVPVGLTKHRKNLFPLKAYTKTFAKQVIQTIDDFNKRIGRNLAFAADEFYLTAKIPIPALEYYGECNQLDNGVGMSALFESQFMEKLKVKSGNICHTIAARVFGSCLKFTQNKRNQKSPNSKNRRKHEISIATGTAAYPMMKRLVDEFVKIYYNYTVHLYSIVNNTFGESVTVAGLLTGNDLLQQLKNKPLGNKLLIPVSMLEHSKTRFLDDITVKQLSKKLKIKIEIVEIDGSELLKKLLERRGKVL